MRPASAGLFLFLMSDEVKGMLETVFAVSLLAVFLGYMGYVLVKENVEFYRLAKHDIRLRGRPIWKWLKLIGEYKRELAWFNELYTKNIDFISKSPKEILRCPYLVERRVHPSLKAEYREWLLYYRDQRKRIREEVLERILKCLEQAFIFLSAVHYLDELEKKAKETLRDLHDHQEHLTNYFLNLYAKRVAYLHAFFKQCLTAKARFEHRVGQYIDAIHQLERITKPTLIERVLHVVSAPVRHTYHLVDGLLRGDQQKALKSGALLGLSFVGGGIIGEAVDALDAAEGFDFAAIDALLANADVGEEYVDPQYVEGYVRSDGTSVSGYWRDGDGDPTTVLTLDEGGGYWRRV